MNSFATRTKAYARRNLGFAFFLAWNYIALYGCAMAIGTFVPYNLEYIWMVAGGAEAVFAGVGLLLTRESSFYHATTWKYVAAACAVLGNVTLWLGYAIPGLYWNTFVVSGMLMGGAVAIMTAVWGSRLSSYDVPTIEFDVLASFIIAFALYGVTLPIKLWGVPNVIAASAFAVASMVLCVKSTPALKRADAAESAGADAPSAEAAAVASPSAQAEDRAKTDGAHAGRTLLEQGSSFSTYAMIASLWVLVAYFRIIAAPIGIHDRYQHYLIPFACAFIVTCALFSLFLKNARHMSVTLAFRWTIPTILLGLAVLSWEYADLGYRTAAFSLDFMSIFGIQIACGMSAAKYARRSGKEPAPIFFGMALAEGLGILIGCGLGLVVVAAFAGTHRLSASLFVFAGCSFVTMLMGFSPAWRGTGGRKRRVDALFPGGRTDDAVPAGLPETVPGAPGEQSEQTGASALSLEDLIRERACALQGKFGLTERETQIAELLLAGRSRPYIRDELYISLNTVHTHASNIFAKCGVHSQQELINLAHEKHAGR